jgi:hypothetical protein
MAWYLISKLASAKVAGDEVLIKTFSRKQVGLWKSQGR